MLDPRAQRSAGSRRACLAMAVLSCLFLLGPSCAATSRDDRTWHTIAAGTWVLQALEQDELIPGSQITLRLEGPSRLFGASDVNRYFGTYERVGAYGIRTGSVASTRMAGPPELLEQEARYLKLLSQVDRVRLVREEEMSLELLAGDQVVLTYGPSR